MLAPSDDQEHPERADSFNEQHGRAMSVAQLRLWLTLAKGYITLAVTQQVRQA